MNISLITFYKPNMSQAKKALDTVIKTMKMLDDAIIKFCCGGYCMTTLINDLAGPEKQMKEVVDQVRLLKPDSNQETSADGAIERGEPDKMNELVRATFYLYKALETGFLDLRDNVEPKGNHYVFFALKDFLVEVVLRPRHISAWKHGYPRRTSKPVQGIPLGIVAMQGQSDFTDYRVRAFMNYEYRTI
ncbi:unnamed protein product [Aspergillus oryzae RIB40]|uniref:DNA, SC005 n=1 Tax=Aspergillus oryzae (strain ATCC 42149 / RIB 40) TaxID=510516 RepID=Q2UQ89_ASPOR|nr:unnamed protein product [Aspergillus oryzae RIB40]BAE56276.1 unnamed protein product [Aspergillus oryzae RIB40]